MACDFKFFDGFKRQKGRPPDFMTFAEQAPIARKNGQKALVKVNRMKRMKAHAKRTS
jgi:hypothetical protein